MTTAREAALAATVTAATLGLQAARHLDDIRSYHAPPLPAFDAFAYVAMAEHPTIFTVMPWGHRILTPWIAHAIPGGPSIAFPVVTLGAFALAGLLLYAFLRRLGARPWAAALGTAAFALSPPTGELIAAPFLVEPLACALLIALLLALEMDLDVAVLVLLAVLGIWAKEAVVVFLPVVCFARRQRRPRAWRDGAVVFASAVVAAALLHVAWTPGMHTPLPDLGPERWHLIGASMAAEPGRWLGVLALGGLGPAAIAGALRLRARPYLGRYAWIVAGTFAQPLLAQYAIHQVVGEMNRYLLYAVPALVPLALIALDRVVPVFDAPPPATAAPRLLGRLATVATVVALVFPLAVLDRYRRLDLQGRRDGLYILGFCRGTLNTARKLRDGAAVLLKMDERRFTPQGFEAEEFERMRWFLRDGWGPAPWYGTEEALMQSDRATLVLPCLTPAPIEITLALSAATETPLRLSVNGRPIGEGLVSTARTRLRFEVPADALFRGDNMVALDVTGVLAAHPRLYAVAYSPIPRSP